MELTLQAMKTLSELMDRALEMDATGRTAWLAELNAGPNAALRPYLADMLARQANMDTAFLVSPVQLSGASLISGNGHPVAKLAAGVRVGPYQLRHEIGHGGMGAVWLAERVDGSLTRQVALKLPMMHVADTFAERFARERDILAQLTHPNIARLYDAGVTDVGQPYLVLEYVEGTTITEHCDALKLNVGQRLDRFLQVARAVQYAHANLVIHRDLKPSNILVTQDGQVRLLDFGIAKLLDQPGGQSGDTDLTRFAGSALTLDYASPEQVNGQPISTASDVYSMGVVLYQLLTGQKPYQLKRDSRGALEDAIVSGEPARMSDVARKTDVAMALVHGATSEKLAKALAGDLDTIVAKAMRKDPAQRYVTVAALAEDIQRYLDGLPVEAQPDSWRYRAGKFVSRNRFVVTASGAVVVALGVGLGVAMWQAKLATAEALRADGEADIARAEKLRADAEAAAAKRESGRADTQARTAVESAARADDEAAAARREALRADREAASARDSAKRADTEANKARLETQRGNAVQNFLVELFRANSNDQKNAVQVRNLSARQLLDRGVERLGETRDMPSDVGADLYRLLGTLYSNLDENARAKQMHERALEAALRAHGKASLPYAAAQLELAWAQGEEQLGARMDLIDSARDFLLRQAPGSELLARAYAYEAQNTLMISQDRSLRASRDALALLERYPDAAKLRAITQRAEAHAYRLKGEYERALGGYRKAADLFAQLYGADNIEVGETKGSMSTCLRMLLRLKEAETTASEAVAIMRPFDGALTDAKAFGRRSIVLKAERGRSPEADAELFRVQRALPQSAGEPHRLDFPMAVAQANVALMRADYARALELSRRAGKLYDGKSPGTWTEILTLEAQARLGLIDVVGADSVLQETRRLVGGRTLPVALSLGLQNVAAEIAAKGGRRSDVALEQSLIASQHPGYRDAPFLRLLDDLSRAQVHQMSGEHQSALQVTRRWLEEKNHELPTAIRGEMALIGAESAINLNDPIAARLLDQADSILPVNDVETSPRLRRLLDAKRNVVELGWAKK